jgi:AraC-like DNA-binding protein
LSPGPPVRLEHSCSGETRGGGVASPGAIERLRIRIRGAGYAMHRHDSYAVGRTLAGVQAFWFRGERRLSLPGQVLVIHPDEPHDGRNGDEAALDYLMLYVAPAALASVSENVGGLPLPFIPDAVRNSTALASIVAEAFSDFPDALPDLMEADLLSRLSLALNVEGGITGNRPRFVDRRAVSLARELLETGCDEPITADRLERATGHSRYALARQFRAAYRTSPHQYLLACRLRRSRRLIAEGIGLAETALLCGFADQSHFTRRFKRGLGLSPGEFRRRWGAGEIALGA